jgi:hypothetical protein
MSGNNCEATVWVPQLLVLYIIWEGGWRNWAGDYGSYPNWNVAMLSVLVVGLELVVW